MEVCGGSYQDVHRIEETTIQDCMPTHVDLKITEFETVCEESSSTIKSCVIVGSTTLAIFCAEHVRAIGHKVCSVLATDEVFKAWAAQEGIHHVDSIAALAAELSEQPVDWLFSVVNRIILAPVIFERVREKAFNYHDSPLPRFAGTNATSWALIAQETRYAVSWHTITTAVDAGQIAIQQPVFIDLQDTALSLNLKCYQAARDSFRKLLVELERGSLVTWPQDISKRCFFRRTRRPKAGACLDWTQSAEALSAMVRGLNFGELHINPLTCPKLMLKTNTVQTNQIQILKQKSDTIPGTLINVNPEGWCITTGSNDVWVSKLLTLEGNPINPATLAKNSGLESGMQLPTSTVEQAQDIRKTLETLAPFEDFWHDRLRVMQPIQLPYETLPELDSHQWVTGDWCEPLHSCASNSRLSILGAFVIYVGRLIRQSRFQLGWRPVSVQDLIRSPPILASIVPMQCDIDLNSSFPKIMEGIEQEIIRINVNKTYPRDLVSRYPDLRAIPALKSAKPWRIVVSMIDYSASEEGPDGALLTLQVDVHGQFRWIYDSQRLDLDCINRITNHLRELAWATAANINTPAAQLNMLPPLERQLLIETWNDTDVPYPKEACVHQLFEQQVNNTPHAIAVVCKNVELCYHQLNAQANQLAHKLENLGATHGSYIATLFERSVELVIAQLAIAKVGAIYVPLDPGAPSDRHRWMVGDCSAHLLITNIDNVSFNIPVLQLKQVDLGKMSVQNLHTSGSSLDIAYVMYTSGTTGLPKGVLVPHQGIARLTLNNGYAEIKPTDRVAFTANPAFDASTFEVWGSLLNGATLVIIDRESVLDSQSFCYILLAERVNILWLTVCLFNQFIDALNAVFAQLDILIVGGDTMHFHSINALLTHKSPKKFLNVYGVTETTTFATTYLITGATDEKGSVPVGRPIANVRIYLLDLYGQPVPIGVVGEIYIGGDGLSCGYLNRPDLTAERFLADPYSDKPEARMYKTGDWARYLPDGNLVILGRDDQQVKIRGFRIELGEIEAKLIEYPSVQQAVVITFGDTEKRLVAYVVVTHEVSAKDLNKFLITKLPDYMIPSAFVQLDSLPLTITGKLNVRALPTPDDKAFAHTFYEAPKSAIETALADIWCDLLDVAQVSRHDSFFSLGGHSLLAMRLNTRIACLGIEMPLDVLFANPTLVKMAKAIQSRQNVGSAMRPSIIAIPRNGALPLSFAQQRLWFLTQLEGASGAYHVPLLLRLEGTLDVCALQLALDTVWIRHEALRSVFVSVDGQPEVHLLNSEQGITLSTVELQDQTQLEALCTEAAQSPFNLINGPLIRALLIRLTDKCHILSLTQHHIVSDGWSFDVLLHELQVLYRAFKNHELNPLLPLTVQYPDYAFWQRQWLTGERLRQQSDYWKVTLADAPVRLDLPTDRFRPSQQSFAGDVVPIKFDRELTLSLKDMNRLHDTTMFMTLLGAWAAVLSRLSGQDQVVIGAPSANRGQREIECLLGFFVNALALRIDLLKELNVAELLSRVKTTVVQAQAHQDLPFEQVVEIIQPPRRLDYTPIFQVIFAWQNHTPAKAKWADLNVQMINSPYIVAKFDLELNLTEIDDEIVGGLVYSTALFNKDSVERHANYLKTFLKKMVSNTFHSINRIDILDLSERELLLHTWNNTQTRYPDQARINQIFEQQAVRTPDATAIIFNDQEISYAKLKVWADTLAHHLLDHGVVPRDYIVILFERSKELIIAQLAILKVNAIYVPLDPHSPYERHTWIINDCSARLLITNMDSTNLSIPTINLNEIDFQAITPLNPFVSGSSLDVAYMMYTSGSTGTPKGVLVTHKGISRLIINNGYAKIKSQDRIGSIANPAFDASTFEIWGALLSGAALVILDRGTVLDTHKFCYVLKSKRINIILLTTGLFNQISTSYPDVFSHLDTLIVGADVLDTRLINAVLSNAPPKNLINAYGPTESTTVATSFQINSVVDERGSVPIGRPISNTRIYLLDAYGQPVPMGAVGEVYIGGDGIAHGYLNRMELTTERFLPDPFVEKPNGQMYKTGDLARYRCDGNLVFLGRNDHQVKIRGFRIELGEIEARLNAHSTVREAIVVKYGDHVECLIAYVVADEVNPGALREYLKIFLPDYMVPSAFVRLDEIPLTSNGKIDRRALPTPGPDAYVHAIYEGPIGAIESTIAEIWRDLLGIEKVSRHDSFFALGGHSLLAVQLCSRIASLGTDLPLAALFTASTLSALAAVIESRRSVSSFAEPLITPLQREGILPLSFAQQRLWFLAQHVGASSAYHIPLVFRLKGALDVGALQQALNAIWARHEALRSVFVSMNGQPAIRLLDPQQGIPLRTTNWEEATQFTSLCFQEAHHPFDLKSGPLIRALLVRLTDDVHKLLLTQHHIVSDGWSIGVLMEDLKLLYGAYRYQKINPLSPLIIQYPDYAAWQREWLRDERLRKQSDYWRAALTDAPVWLNLPIDRSRPTEQSFSGDSVPIELDLELTLHLKRLSRQNDVTLFMTLLSAWAAVLSRLSGQDEIIIGVPSANRGQLQVECLIGFFVNMLAIRVDLRDQPSMRELLKRVKTSTVEAYDHQDLPFEEVVEIVQPPRRLDSTPIFQVLFAWQNEEKRTWTWPDLDVTLEKSTYDIVKFDLELSLTEVNNQIVGTLAFSSALFNKSTIQRQAKYFQTLLKVFATNVNVDHPVAMMEILDSSERDVLITDWNNTQMSYCKETCIHQLFEQQVERTPNGMAIFFEGEKLSYSQLNVRANKLAHRLIKLAVTPEARIAICVERSPALIVGFLAILKAGAAYVPLDPTYKSKRLTDILTDADPMIVLADDRGRSSIGETFLLSRIVIDPNEIFIRSSEANPILPELTFHHLAYIIYTSGSTGVPKGVMVEHRSLVNLAEDLVVRFKPKTTSRLLFFASCGFDAHLFDIVIAFNSGASLYILPDKIRWDEHRLLLYLQEHAITHVTLPPSIIHAWKDQLENVESETIIFEGEILSTSSFQKLFDAKVVYNGYGLTEVTICSILWQCHSGYVGQIAPIGRPISNTRIYILDSYRHLLPLGSVGELYVGGDGVARGYLNRIDLTAELFFEDPFSCDPNARMYKTGDLAYYLPDGNLICLGRKDHQIKIRGVRIELGEIETKLIEHPAVREAVVVALGKPSERLAAYVIADEITPIALREYLRIHLPDFMIPTFFIKLSAFPVTSSGKLDRHALPLPDEHALPYAVYEEPIGRIEIILADIWREVLNVEKISRYDSFFALGGHSLLAIQAIERLRAHDLSFTVRDLFQTPVLTTLAGSLKPHTNLSIPPNVITGETETVTPDMLPLIDVTQNDINRIITCIPGGIGNLQDIYALSPLQDGILFHHLLTTDCDPYLASSQLVFKKRATLDRYLNAAQKVVNRHDILRTAFIWEGLSVPAQVVWRNAPLSITELTLDRNDGSISEQLNQRFNPRRYKMDLTEAPLIRFIITQDEIKNRWILLSIFHHLIGDHITLDIMQADIKTFLDGLGNTLPPAEPFRNLIAQTRSGISIETHDNFFRHMLTPVTEPTLPFGLTDLHLDGSQITDSLRMLPAVLQHKLRIQAQYLNVSLASLCHVAYGQVLSRISGQSRVVFNTVLSGRVHAGTRFDIAMGLFINVLPFRVDLGETNVTQTIHLTHLRLAELLEHEHASLMLAQQCSGVIPGMPLTNALLNYRHHTVGSIINSMNVEFIDARERSNFPITLAVEDFGTALGVMAQVQLPVQPERVCGYMEEALINLADALEHTPNLAIRKLEIIPQSERELLLKTWNKTQTFYSDHQCIHQLFEEQVKRTPNASAIFFGNSQLSYAQLNFRANQLAHLLLKNNLEPHSVVAICVDRSPAMIVGLLSILKVGAAYVPLDPNDPSERLAQILADSKPKIVLADTVGRETLAHALDTRIVIDPNDNCEEPKVNLTIPGLTSHHLAYVMFTSGSTGVPKGVEIGHQGLVNRIQWIQRAFPLTPNDRVLQKTPFTFDVSFSEIFWTLNSGATMVIAAPGVHRDSTALAEIMAEEQITVLHIVPSMLNVLVNEGSLKDCHHLNLIACSGEELSPVTIKHCQDQLPHVQVINFYGPTETTIDSTYWSCPPHFNDSYVPIGRPISNMKIYLLDQHEQLVPLGAMGEICIAGVGLARGYLNRAELSAKKFCSDPFSRDSTTRMYKTGDLARYLPDGNLIFCGRTDRQIKIRGVRIEPGEIEARLVLHAAVREAVVVALTDRDQRLIAYVVADDIDPIQLYEYLRSYLPHYMIPSAIKKIDALPRMPNGKLNYRALPALDANAFSHATYEMPLGPTETILAEVWRNTLDVEQVSRYDSFFALGGHSLLAVQVIARLRDHGWNLEIRDIFRTPMLATLAGTLTRHERTLIPSYQIDREAVSITPKILPLINLTQNDINKIIARVPDGIANIQDIYSLTPLQEGILFHHLLSTDGDLYLISSQMAFSKRVALNRYITAFQQVINRNDILRTAFIWEDISVPAQVVWRNAPLSVTELTLDPKNGSITEQLRQRFNPRQYRIELTHAPLIRFVIAEDKTENQWVLLILFHHLIGDNTTFDSIHDEIQAFLEHREDTLSLAEPFRNFIAQARLGIDSKSHELYFSRLLAEITEPTLPFGLADVRNGSHIAEAHRMLSTKLDKKLRSQATRLNVSLACLCYVAWAQVLSRTTGQARVVFATVLFGRMRAGKGSERSMGLFVNTLPFRVDLDENNIVETVRNTHLRLAELLEHEHASLALAQQCSSVPTGMPLTSALLNYRHTFKRNNILEMDIKILGAQQSTNYPFTVTIEDCATALGVTAQVQLPVEPERICGYMEQALMSLAEALEHTPNLKVRKLEIMPQDERELLLQTWNSTKTSYPDEACIHYLFEQQVDRVPNATAIVFGKDVLSYEQLNMRANKVCKRLIELGVKLTGRVAICMEQSPTMIISILAILKAGAAYVPLDPSYPYERLANILKDANPIVILADGVGRKILGDALLGCTIFDPNEEFTNPGSNLLIPDLTARHLAYIIYTSGSTGMPKGVMIEHRSVVNYSLYAIQRYESSQGEGSVMASSIAFDLTFTAIFPTLLSGRILHIPLNNADPIAWRSTILCASKLAPVKFTPSHLALLQDVSSIETAGQHIHTLVLGGEVPSNSVLERWHDYSPKTRVFNEYGPTETTVGCVVHEIRYPIMENGFTPIGRPIANTKIYLIDQYGQLVPLGVDGEICIGGHGVARGYLNLPDLSAERFVPDPFVDDRDARMYKTGDLARYLSNGNLVFLGRNDKQIKIRGFRIEPGEIESRLAEHPAVHEAVVVAVEDPDKRLIAYIIADKIEPAALSRHLRKYLPEHMVPGDFIKIDSFPLTPNGKVDYRALPMPSDTACRDRKFEAPVGPVEIAMAEIWCEVLGIEQVSRRDSFFALGGHSILAITMIQRAISCSLPCSLNELFEEPILADFACRITSTYITGGHRQAIPVRSTGSELPLFFVPTGLGDHSYVFSLARHIHSKYPVYALPWPFESETNPCTIQVLAEKMITLMKSIQSKGPYRIAGYSAGGVLSYAIAEFLLGLDETVAFVGLIDVAPPHLLRNLSTTHLFCEYLARHTDQQNFSKILDAGKKLNAVDCHNLICSPEKLRLLGSNLPYEFVMSAWVRINFFAKATSSYEPLFLPLNIYQFYSTEVYHPRSSVDENHAYVSKNVIIDEWNKIKSHTFINFIPVPGDHSTMMSEASNRKELGKAFNQVLETLSNDST